MSPYLALFIATSLAVQLAGSRRRVALGARVGVCAIVGAWSAVFAGVRDFGVGGPDVFIYGNGLFELATLAGSFASYVEAAESRFYITGEYGYLLVNFAVSRFTSDPRWFYAVLSFMTSMIVLMAILAVRDRGSAGLMWFTYMCFYYVWSFNFIRQAPALALVLLSVALTIRERWWLSIIPAALATQFHSSAFAFFLVLAIVRLASRDGELVSYKRSAVLVIGAAVGVGLYSVILRVATDLITDPRYVYYLGGGSRAGWAINPSDLHRALLAIAVIEIIRRRATARSRPTLAGDVRHFSEGAATRVAEHPAGGAGMEALVLVLAIEAILLPVRAHVDVAQRVLVYFGVVNVFVYPWIARQARAHRTLVGLGVALVNIMFLGVRIVPTTPGGFSSRYSSEILARWLAGGWFWAIAFASAGMCLLLFISGSRSLVGRSFEARSPEERASVSATRLRVSTHFGEGKELR